VARTATPRPAAITALRKVGFFIGPPPVSLPDLGIEAGRDSIREEEGEAV
jgi:hypothetical protein